MARKSKMQRNWIGKSVGAEIDFKLQGVDKKIKIFTTRPDEFMGRHSSPYPLTIKLFQI